MHSLHPPPTTPISSPKRLAMGEETPSPTGGERARVRGRFARSEHAMDLARAEERPQQVEGSGSPDHGMARARISNNEAMNL